MDAEEINKIMNGEELPPARKNGDSNNKSEELPDHVKKMMENKKSRSEESKSSDKNNDAN